MNQFKCNFMIINIYDLTIISFDDFSTIPHLMFMFVSDNSLLITMIYTFQARSRTSVVGTVASGDLRDRTS